MRVNMFVTSLLNLYCVKVEMKAVVLLAKLKITLLSWMDSEDCMPKSDRCGMVLIIFRCAKSAIVSDASGANGFRCNDNVEDGNAEHSDGLKVGVTDGRYIQMSEVRPSTLKCSKQNEGQWVWEGRRK